MEQAREPLALTHSDLGSILDELQENAFRNLLHLTTLCLVLWYIRQGFVTPRRSLIILIVFLVQGVIYYLLMQRRVSVAKSLFILGALAFCGLGIRLFHAPQAVFVYPLVALATVVIAGPVAAVAVGMAGIAISYYLLLGLSPGTEVMAAMLSLVFSTALTVVIACSLSYHLRLTTQWSLISYKSARLHLRAVEERRAEVVRLNQELNRTRERLELANAALVRAWRATEEAEHRQKLMTAFIAHELRTPLNLIIGFSEMLAISPETYGLDNMPPNARHDLNAIYQSSRQLSALVDDVLDMASASYGELTLMREPSDLGEIIAEAANMVRDYTEARKLMLTVRCEGNLPPLLVDRVRIRQVLLNLLMNAARFTEEGSITVTARVEGDCAIVEVIDTGRGIPAESLEVIFREFRSTDGVDSAWGKGSGLGLPMSKRLVELHGGEISVQSRVGEGTAFRLSLPSGADHVRVDALKRDQPSAPFSRKVPKPVVLVLTEDEATVHRLERWSGDYRVVPVERAALLARIQDLDPAAVVTDQDDPLPDAALPVPVVRCPLPSSHRWARELRTAGYLAKPVRAQELLRAIEGVDKTARRILIVDDDTRFVQLLSRMLEAAPVRYEVQMAYSGEQALEKWRATDPDVVLLDLALPILSGYEVLQVYRADPALARTPVIVISAPPAEADILPLGNRFGLHEPRGLQAGQVAGILQAVLATLRPTASTHTNSSVSAT